MGIVRICSKWVLHLHKISVKGKRLRKGKVVREPFFRVSLELEHLNQLRSISLRVF